MAGWGRGLPERILGARLQGWGVVGWIVGAEPLGWAWLSGTKPG